MVMTPSWFPSGPLGGPPREVPLPSRSSADFSARPRVVLLVSGTEDVRRILDDRQDAYAVTPIASIDALEGVPPGADVVVLCSDRIDAIGLERLQKARRLALDTPIVVVSAPGPVFAVSCVEAGAEDHVASDELGQLDRAIRHAVARRKSHLVDRWMEHGNRLTALGTLAAGIAHEVNNPVTAALIGATLLEERLDQLHRAPDLDPRARSLLDESSELLGEIADGLERIKSAIKNVESFARPQPEQAELIDVAELCRRARRIVAAEVRERASYRERLRASGPIVGDARQLEQVLVNLLINAAHATPPGAPERNYVAVETFESGSMVVIAVTDSGSGIPQELMDRIFEPFFTTKPRERGSGLGLWICARIVARMGGRILVSSEVGKGSRFEVVLPIAATAESSVSGL